MYTGVRVDKIFRMIYCKVYVALLVECSVWGEIVRVYSCPGKNVSSDDIVHGWSASVWNSAKDNSATFSFYGTKDPWCISNSSSVILLLVPKIGFVDFHCSARSTNSD